MFLPKRLDDMVTFAVWCEKHRVNPALAAEMCCLLEKRARYYAKHYKESPKIESALADVIAKIGLTNVEWPGLYPTFTTPGGYDNISIQQIA